MLLDVASMLHGLDKVMDEKEKQSQVGDITNVLPMMQEDEPDADLGSSLCMMYDLGRSFLQYFPGVLLSSAAFFQIFASATGTVNRKDPDVALVAASFLRESIQARANDNCFKSEQATWKLPSEVLTQLDQVVNLYGMRIAESILRRLVLSDVVESLKEALTDVFYGLRISYPSLTRAAIVSTLNAADFPGKAGFKMDSDKEQFLVAVLRQPPHPRLRFQDLLRVFSGVCQTLVSAEALQQF